MKLQNNLDDDVRHIFIHLRFFWGGESQTDNVLFQDLARGRSKEKVARLMLDGCPGDLRMAFVGVGTCLGEDVRFNDCADHLDGYLNPGSRRISPPAR